MIILVTSRSQQGKTFFCKELLKLVNAAYFNNDDVRRQTNNWNFEPEGRLLAAQNMRKAVNQSSAEIKIVDMICPTKELRAVISPDIIVFIDGDEPSKYPDTDALYEKPTKEESKRFFSCWTRKTGELVQRLALFLRQNPQI